MNKRVEKPHWLSSLSGDMDGSAVKRVVMLLLLVNFATRFLILIRPLIYLDNIVIKSFFNYSLISDDSYICLKIAKNIASGLGPTFDGISYTNGFQPLYVFLMVPVFHLFPNDLVTPVHLSLLILSVFDTLSLYLLYKLSLPMAKSLIAPIILVLLWIFNPYVISTTLNGMETMISFFFVLLFLYYYEVSQPLESTKRSFFLGMILGVAMLARIDSIFLGFSLLLILTYGLLRKKVFLQLYVKRLFAVGIGALLTYSPWILYSYVFTKDIFPISGKAIRLITLSSVNRTPTLGNLYLPGILKGLKTILSGNSILIGLLFVISLCYLYVVRFGKLQMKMFLDKIKRLGLIYLFCVSLFFAYVLYFFAPYYFPRYLFPTILAFLFFLLTLTDLLWGAAKRKSHKAFVILPSIVSIVLAISVCGFTKFYLSKELNCGYMNIGFWAKEQLEPGSIIGSCQSGALGYYADNLKVINLDGVVNKPCYEALRKRHAIEYIKGQKIKYVLGWTVNFEFLSRQTVNYKKADFMLMDKILHFKSWDQYWYVTMVNSDNLDSMSGTK